MKPLHRTKQRITISIINTVALILCATLCVWLCGCRSSRSSSDTTYQRTQQAVSTTITTTDVWSFLNQVRQENTLTDTEIEWEIYDTSTTDSTGAHPVVAKGTTRQTQKQEATTTIAAADSTKQTITAIEDEQEAEQLTQHTEQEAEATPIFKQTYRFVIVLCLLAVLVLALIIYIKKRLLK